MHPINCICHLLEKTLHSDAFVSDDGSLCASHKVITLWYIKTTVAKPLVFKESKINQLIPKILNPKAIDGANEFKVA